MPSIEVLTRVKKETMAEVHRYCDEEDLRHFFWHVKDPANACVECKRRDGRLVNEYEIKYTLDAEFCRAEGDEVCPFELEATKVRTVVEERDRQLAVLAELEEGGAEGVRWLTADVEGLSDRCIKRDGRVFTLDQARAELQGDFCQFADPQRGCECTFEVVPPEVAASVAAPPTPEPVAKERSGCGASAAVFALALVGAAWALS